MNHRNCRGNFVISLDFELMWGVRDVTDIYSYGSNILNVHNVIPRILEIFEKNKIRATFASVGFLFHKNIVELMKDLPDILPQYKNTYLSPYNEYLKSINEARLNDKLHFAPDVIFKIEKKNGLHEIATHTYSHFYCRAIGATKDAFKSDISKSVSVAALNNIRINSNRKTFIILPLLYSKSKFNFCRFCHFFRFLFFLWRFIRHHYINCSKSIIMSLDT